MDPHFQEYPQIANEPDTEPVNLLKKYLHYKDDKIWSRYNIQYRQVLEVLKSAQLLFVAFVIILVIITPETREYIILTSWTGRAMLFLTEISSWGFLVYGLGIDRLPVNYFSLVIMRIFVATDTKFEYSVPNFENRMWKKARVGSTMNDDKDSDFTQLHSKNFLLLTLFLAVSYVITKFTKISIAKMESLALISSFISSVTGTLILILAPSIDRIGVDVHLTLCKTWTYGSFLLSFFLAFFLFQRLFLQYNNQIKQSHLSRLQLETIITLAQIYIVLQYIPVIHPKFSLRGCMKDDVLQVVGYLIPSHIQPIVWQSIPNAMFVITTALKSYYDAIPNSMAYLEGAVEAE